MKVKVDGIESEIDVDDGIVPLVVVLNASDTCTLHSCQGHERSGGGYISIGARTRNATIRVIAAALAAEEMAAEHGLTISVEYCAERGGLKNEQIAALRADHGGVPWREVTLRFRGALTLEPLPDSTLGSYMFYAPPPPRFYELLALRFAPDREI